jgi:hypothetical protein
LIQSPKVPLADTGLVAFPTGAIPDRIHKSPAGGHGLKCFDVLPPLALWEGTANEGLPEEPCPSPQLSI